MEASNEELPPKPPQFDRRGHRISDVQRAKDLIVAEKRREIRERDTVEREKKDRLRQELKERKDRERRDIVARKEQAEKAKRELREVQLKERMERRKIKPLSPGRPDQPQDTPPVVSANHNAPPALSANQEALPGPSSNHNTPSSASTNHEGILTHRVPVAHSGFSLTPANTRHSKHSKHSSHAPRDKEEEEEDSTLLRLWNTMGLPFTADIKSAHVANARDTRQQEEEVDGGK